VNSAIMVLSTAIRTAGGPARLQRQALGSPVEHAPLPAPCRRPDMRPCVKSQAPRPAVPKPMHLPLADQFAVRPGSVSSFRQVAIMRTNIAISANSARNRLTDFAPFRLFSPFRAAFAFPSAVRGPVDFCHGRLCRADRRRRSRPSGVTGPRRMRLLRPAATRRGFGGCFGLGTTSGVTSKFDVTVIFSSTFLRLMEMVDRSRR